MLSAKLIHLIESHWDQITARVLRRIRTDPQMRNIGALPEAELREWGQDILCNLGYWLTAGNEQELARRYEELGRIRHSEGIPLYEALRGLMLTKRQTLDFVQEQGLVRNTLDAFAEEELERHVDTFFDVLLCHLARGYENAMREVASPVVRMAGARA